MLSKRKPPTNAQRIFSWDQTPNLTAPAAYLLEEEGKEPRQFIVSKNTRRVLEALMLGPVYAASYCRISDKVLPLRRDCGVDIECVIYEGDVPTKRKRFGVYYLRSKVTLIDVNEVAA